MHRVLILGGTGKMGTALAITAPPDAYSITRLGSADFDAADRARISTLVDRHRPDIIINAVALLGIDTCERQPSRCFDINALLPRDLALIGKARNCLLVHFSTECVFADLSTEEGRGFSEIALPQPLNMYGSSKYTADIVISALAGDHYVFRLPLLFGPALRAGQFVERIIGLAANGPAEAKISSDVFTSPSYSLDIARAIWAIIDERAPSGLYHLANDGRASLYELMSLIVETLELPLTLTPVSHTVFPSLAAKATDSPLITVKRPALRPWQDAAADYCSVLRGKRGDRPRG